MIPGLLGPASAGGPPPGVDAGASAARPTEEPARVGGGLVLELPLASIRPNPRQPRRTFDQPALQALADSIAEHGRVLQPIIVRPAGDAVGFEIVAGERRWRASALAGLSSIRAILDGVDDATSATMALTENMVRADLNPVEEARGCAALRDNFGLSVAEIARRVGRDRTAISHLLRMLELPDVVLDQIAAGVLSEGHGRVLLRLAEHGDRVDLARRCVRHGWSVRELERQVAAITSGRSAAQAPRSADESAALEIFAEQLTPLFGPSPVQIVPRLPVGYELRVGFHNFAALQAAIARLTGAADGAE